ncbi:hypothetical protein C8R45DRAFT_929809 [Mycena sanguinolenta]|nr:hypothetical protein C8R45DRAFT_929809 [Mycena sanguinolenta]
MQLEKDQEELRRSGIIGADDDPSVPMNSSFVRARVPYVLLIAQRTYEPWKQLPIASANEEEYVEDSHRLEEVRGRIGDNARRPRLFELERAVSVLCSGCDRVNRINELEPRERARVPSGLGTQYSALANTENGVVCVEVDQMVNSNTLTRQAVQGVQASWDSIRMFERFSNEEGKHVKTTSTTAARQRGREARWSEIVGPDDRAYARLR